MQDNTEEKQDFLLKQAQQLLEQNAEHRLQPLLEETHPNEIGQLIMSLPSDERLKVWQYVPQELVGLVLVELGDPVRSSLMDEMQTPEVIKAIGELGEDEQADLIQDIPDRTEEILEALDEDRRRRLEAVIYYPEDVAGGIMDVNTVSIRADVSVSTVLRYLRKLGSLPDGTNKLFVIDRSGHYLGQVLISTLVTVSSEKTIGEIYDSETLSISADMGSKDVADLFAKFDLITAAVVDSKNMLLGRVTVENIIDLLIESKREAILKLPLSRQEDIFSSAFISSRSRTLWLGINLITALIASWVIGNFEDTISEMVTLAVLMPLVASMGGIAGTQTLSLVTRSLALGQLRKSNRLWLLAKEFKVGIINGILWAIFIGLIAFLWFNSLILGSIVAAAILINLITATTSGVIVPIVMNRLDIDPAISGGVVLTTITDIIGFFSFLGLATLLIM